MQIHAYRRTEKTAVDLFGLNLVFVPNSTGHVVCEVSDQRAIDRLLGIPEGYRQYDGTGVLPPVAQAPVAAAVATLTTPPGGGDDNEPPGEDDIVFDAELLGSPDLPPTFDVLGVTYTQAQLVDLAFVRSGMKREEWNLNDADDREALIEGEVVKLTIAAEQKAKEEAEAKAAAEAAAAPAVAPAPAPAPAPEPEPAAVSFVISNGEETIDLRTLSAAKLREFATTAGVELPKGNSVKVDDLRLMLAKALAAAE